MKKIVIHTSFFLMLVASISSCKKDLVIEPRQSIRTENALVNRDNINAAITGVIARLKSTRLYGRDLVAVAEALGDNGNFTNRSGRLAAENLNNPGAHFASWQTAYYAIAEINLIFAAIPNLKVTPVITTAERNNWVGQLYYLRALLYHDLMRCYAYEPNMGVPGQDRGGVPIVLSTPTSIEAAIATLPPRASITAVYDLIYKDLDSAVANLTNPSTFSPFVPTRLAAQGLDARVALYKGDYAKAKTLADNAIAALPSTGVRVDNASGYIAGWSGQRHTEALFELRFQNPAENIGVNESLHTSYTSINTRGNNTVLGGFGDLVLSTGNGAYAMLGLTGASNAITSRSDDVRNLLFEVGSAGRGPARVECTKFIGKNGIPNLDNIPVMRSPELYLIRAEAQATAGSPVLDLAAALIDLQFVKQNRYTNYATTQATADAALAGSQSNLFNEIIRQRRIEFAFEGHRWFDAKRLGFANPTIWTKALLYTDFKVLAGIPIREIDNNVNMVQNFGY